MKTEPKLNWQIQGASSLEKIAEELPLKAVLMDVTSDEDVKKAKEFVIANMSYGRSEFSSVRQTVSEHLIVLMRW